MKPNGRRIEQRRAGEVHRGVKRGVENVKGFKKIRVGVCGKRQLALGQQLHLGQMHVLIVELGKKVTLLVDSRGE